MTVIIWNSPTRNCSNALINGTLRAFKPKALPSHRTFNNTSICDWKDCACTMSVPKQQQKQEQQRWPPPPPLWPLQWNSKKRRCRAKMVQPLSTTSVVRQPRSHRLPRPSFLVPWPCCTNCPSPMTSFEPNWYACCPQFYILSGFYLSSEREVHTHVDSMVRFNYMMQEVLVPKGYRIINLFDLR